MAEVSYDTKQKIDSMSIEELLIEKNKGNLSNFQKEKHSYLLTRIEVLQGQGVEQHQQETLNVAKQANAISKESNLIATKALEISKQSKNLSMLAIVISIVAIVVSMYFLK